MSSRTSSGDGLARADLPLLRRLRDVYAAMIEQANRMKAAERDPAMLLACCSVLDELQAKAERCDRALSRFVGTPEGCRGAAPADKGHGCPAFALPVGTGLEALPDRSKPLPENPLFFASELQELPGAPKPLHNQSALAGERNS